MRDKEVGTWSILGHTGTRENASTTAQEAILGASTPLPDTLPMPDTETPQNGEIADTRTETEKRCDAKLAEFLAQRRQKGRETYGKGLDWDDAKYREKWAFMALEELADAVQYLVAENMRLEEALAEEKYWREAAIKKVLKPVLELSEKYQDNK